MIKRAIVVIIFFQFALLSADSVENLAKELIKLRGEVESLHAELDTKKQEYKSRLNALSMQRAELEATINKERMRIKQLQQMLTKKKQEISKDVVDTSYLIPVAEKAIGELETYVDQSLPFKKKERLKVLSDIKEQMQSGLLQPHRALNRIWSFCEDELRMTRENGLYRQTIKIGNQEFLTNVARLGMIMMFFKTNDNRVGTVVKTPQGWNYKLIDGKEDRERIFILFDSLKKQIRSGFFELPWVLPEMENK